MTWKPEFANYWYRKQRLTQGTPHFPVRRWWPTADLCDIEQVYFQAIRQCHSLLDVGAGDLRVMKKLQAAGYLGKYHTQDIGDEHAYTYRDLSEVSRTYDAILCLDVLEHMPLLEGLTMINRLYALLEPCGVLVVQTPNARCIRFPLSWDMTHLHCYNLNDLWAYLTSLELVAEGYRVVFAPRRRTLAQCFNFAIAAYITTRILGCDYADNIALIARKQALPPND